MQADKAFDKYVSMEALKHFDNDDKDDEGCGKNVKINLGEVN